jgi:hypothetical protein
VSFRASSPLVWFAVGGGAVAWILQHVAGISFGFAQCDAAGRSVPVHALQITTAAFAALVALSSMAVAAWLLRSTYRTGDVFAEERRGDGATPPVGRINFLAIVGLTVNLLALIIIILDGVGAPLLHLCQQS